ncbi:MAG: murein biosynthesis integral membrane protein MurJ [Anaerolineae bacterium]|nr:murein biosynthesis integral membrane protein MurJ [Anaerolineae bacterium]
MTPTAEFAQPADRVATGLARSATILSLGNVASRVLGLVRETVIAGIFGATGAVSAFRLAARVPTMIYDLLVGGMLSAALVPVLSDYARPSRREELWQAAGAVFSFLAVVLAVIVLAVELLAGPLAYLLGTGLTPELQAVTARSLRIIAPTVLIFGCAGLVTALLYALNRFTFPAIAAAVFNLGIVVAAPLLAGRLDIYSLAVGVLGGSLAQLLIQLPGLRDARLRLGWNLHHPALRRIGRLYLPVAVGLVVGQLQVVVDGNLATRTGERSVAWMQNATTLREFPLGLVSVAISLAALPTLSRFAAEGDWPGYRRTLARGLRLVLVLTLPAAFGLFVLAQPAVQLIFEHGEFTPFDTVWTSRALWGYIPGLLFAAVDWPLNYACYARQDTRTPTLVGIAAVGVYLVVALALLRPLGMIGLVLADSAKHVFHALAMLTLLRRDVGHLGGQRVVSTAFKALLASAVMGGVIWLALPLLRNGLGTGSAWSELLLVVAAGGLGLVVYGGLLALLRVEELGLLRDIAARRRSAD